MVDASSGPATDERLLDAAEAEFAAHGFADARLEDIAAAAGVRRASLLYHFESKQALYEQVLERAFGELRGVLTSALTRRSVSFIDRLDDVIARSIDAFTRRPFFARLCLRNSLDEDRVAAERARVHVAPLLELGEQFLVAGQRAGELRDDLEPRALLMVLVSSILLHGAMGDLQRDVLWGDGRATGRGLRAYRDAVRGIVHAAVEKRPASSRPRGSGGGRAPATTKRAGTPTPAPAAPPSSSKRAESRTQSRAQSRTHWRSA